MKKFYTLLLGLLLSVSGFAQEQSEDLNRELRSAWIATVFGLDWPNSSHSAEQQKAALIEMLDELQRLNFNAAFFQIRTECDALYKSSYEPWSRFLTGTVGKDPDYDPLQFAIEEAHKRGIELHAWLNPYRVNASVGYVYPEEHISNKHPEWVLKYKSGKYILDPGIPEVTEYITDIVADVVENYNVDGIHFDDYFYSYDGTTTEDRDTFDKYGKDEYGGNMAQWRRDNITGMVASVNQRIKDLNPSVRFGISPFGIWKSGVPEGIVGMSAYDQIYADALAWLGVDIAQQAPIAKPIVDYITPQLYWKFGGGQDYGKLVAWWAEQCKKAERHLYAGHELKYLDEGVPAVAARKTNNVPSDLHELKGYMNLSGLESNLRIQTSLTLEENEIARQIAEDRTPENRANNSLGSVFFRAEQIMEGVNAEDVFGSAYSEKALPPYMSWLDVETPNAPTDFSIVESNGVNTLSWTDNSSEISNKKFAVYQKQEGRESKLYELTYSTSVDVPTNEVLNYEVKVLSASNVIGELELVKPIAPVVTKPTEIENELTSDEVVIEWTLGEDAVGAYYEWATSATFEEGTIISALETSEKSANFTDLVLGEHYYFRIRAYNALSGYGEWSENIYHFYMKNEQPLAPIVVDAEESNVLNADSVNIIWEHPMGINTVHYQWATTSDFAVESIISEEEVVESISAWFKGLVFGQKYYFRIRSKSVVGDSEWSKVYEYYINEKLLLAPAISKPTKVENEYAEVEEITVKWKIPIAVKGAYYQWATSPSFEEASILEETETLESEFSYTLEEELDYYFRIRSNAVGIESEWSEVYYFFVTKTPTGVDKDELNAVLKQNQPNPASTQTDIPFVLENRAEVQVAVYNVLGKVVFMSDRTTLGVGTHKVTLDVSLWTEGMYFYSVIIDGIQYTKKMMVE